MNSAYEFTLNERPNVKMKFFGRLEVEEIFRGNKTKS